MAQIIIAKHRKGATGDVLLNFRGEFTRFENPEDRNLDNRPPMDGGEIRGSRLNGEDNYPIPPIDNGPLPF
jgi:replicative DNA helicase